MTAFLRNLGLIDGGDEAIQTGENATIINEARGAPSSRSTRVL